jgi:hypothetical protein
MSMVSELRKTFNLPSRDTPMLPIMYSFFVNLLQYSEKAYHALGMLMFNELKDYKQAVEFF